MAITKAVIPAAGLGTRFLPATKAQPKEMLPVVDKPAIQYVVEDAARAGLTDILIVTGRGKDSIENHFDRSVELEDALRARGDTERLAEVRAISDMADIHYIRQKEPRGLGHAVMLAERHVGGEPFAVLLGDTIVPDGLLPRMVDGFARERASIIALMEVPIEEISHYGAVRAEPAAAGLIRVLDIVEKPAPAEAPSTTAVLGQYLFTSEIFGALHRIAPGVGGELQLTDAIRLLVRESTVLGLVHDGVRYDIGKKLDYLRATVELAAGREDLGPEFREFLAEFVVRNKLV